MDSNDPLRLLRRKEGSRSALFGAIRFPTSKRPAAKWACISNNSAPELIIRMFKGVAWKLAPPRVVISVTGAARFTGDSKLPERVEMQFRRGLQRAVLATKGWVVTGGTAGGVMSLVGRMVQELDESVAEEVVVLGVAAWGAIAEHQQMDKLAHGKIFKYPDGPPKRGVQLDPNHTHFLFVEDGHDWKFGAEIELRAALEHALCTWAQETSGGISAPMVLLVVGGGIGTLETVLSQLQRKAPVVCIEESGGACRHLYLFWSKPKVQAEDAVRGELLELFAEGRSNLDVTKIPRYLELLADIVELGRKPQDANKAEQLSFFHGANVHGSGSDLDQIILRAILSDCERTADAVMHAVLWGQPAIIRHQLQSSHDADPRGLGQAFEQALLAASKEDNFEARRVIQEVRPRFAVPHLFDSAAIV